MDKPVVSVGEPGDWGGGPWWGWGDDWQLLGASPTRTIQAFITLHSPRAFPSLQAPLHPSWGREQLRQGGDHPLPVLFLGTPKSSDP